MQKRKRTRQMAEINVVPYIDVMLVLLVIFMVTAPLLSQGVKVDLPQAQAQPLASDMPEPLIISIDKQGNYYLNTATNPNAPIKPQELTEQVAQQLLMSSSTSPSSTLSLSRLGQQQTEQSRQLQGQLKESWKVKRQVLVKGDKEVDYGKVVQAMVILKNAGASNVGLMTQFDENAKGNASTKVAVVTTAFKSNIF